MRNPIFPVALLCMATSLLVACPQVPERSSSEQEARIASAAPVQPLRDGPLAF